MKILILILAVALLSCNHESDQKKVYLDSVHYYSERLRELADHPADTDSAKIVHDNQWFLCKTMRQYYIDKSK